MLVEKLAAEAGLPLLCISPAAILSKWAGESEKGLAAVFDAASRQNPAAIVFIDEVDSLAPTRWANASASERQPLPQLQPQSQPCLSSSSLAWAPAWAAPAVAGRHLRHARAHPAPHPPTHPPTAGPVAMTWLPAACLRSCSSR
jgi:hypothetical protein